MLDCLKRCQSDPHATILTDWVSLLQEVKSGMGGPDWHVSTFRNSCGCSSLDMPESKEMTEQIDQWAKQQSQVVYISEDLKCWGAWDAAKDAGPLVTGKRGGAERESARRSSWKDEQGLLSVRWTLELFQRQCWGNFRQGGLSPVHRCHVELNWDSLSGNNCGIWDPSSSVKISLKQI